MATEKQNITATEVVELVQRQGYLCAISGRKLTPETASLDHIVPFSRGGEHSIRNVWVVDHQVNIAKGTLSLEEFLAMCEDVVRWRRQGGERVDSSGKQPLPVRHEEKQ